MFRLGRAWQRALMMMRNQPKAEKALKTQLIHNKNYA